MTALLLLLLTLVAAEPKTPQQLATEARAAYDRKAWPEYLALNEQLAAALPDHPIVIFNHGGALALNGRPADAMRELQRLGAMELVLDLSDTDLDSLRSRDDFRAVEARMRAIAATPVAKSSIAFRIPSKELTTEAIAYDAKSGAFFVSSVKKRKIVRIARDGSITDFVTAGIWGSNGLGIDAKRRLLYATSTASERSDGYAKEIDVALFAFDLDNGKLVAKYDAPKDGRHYFDDLTVADDGTVYVSDASGAVYRLKDGKLAEFAKGMRAPQGSAIRGGALYVADYGGAIWSVDLRSGKTKALELPSDFAAVGIDGMEIYGDSLIAIQNGVNPHRVVRLTLQGERVTAWQVLERNHPAMDEPTLGVVVGSNFYYVAASAGHKEAAVLRLPL
jgi:sugar lactone lactonase YvrE